MENLKRVSDVLNLLRKTPTLSAGSITSSLSISMDELRQTLEFIKSNLMIPVEFNDNIVKCPDAESFSFNAKDLHYLYTIGGMLNNLQTSEYSSLFTEITDSLNSTLGLAGYSPEMIKSKVTVKNSCGDRTPDFFTTINNALMHYRVITIVYQSRTTAKVAERIIEPHRLLFMRNTWYLIANCRLNNELRTFAVERIQEISSSGETFRALPDEIVDCYLDSGFGVFTEKPLDTAVLRFAPQAAAWVRYEKWHPDQTMVFHDDGSLTMRVPYLDQNELVMEIMKHGPHVEVIEPWTLRKTISSRIFATNRIYNNFKQRRNRRTTEENIPQHNQRRKSPSGFTMDSQTDPDPPTWS